jgi:hypothetical protein
VRRKLSFALALPIVQVAITAVLGVWADRVDWILLANTSRAPGRFVHLDLIIIEARLIWRGINAPTYPLYLAGSSNRQILGFGVGEILYLAAVVVLWYWVGRFFDRRRGLEGPTSQRIKKLKTVCYVLMMAWGIFLLFVSLWTVRAEVSFARSYFFRIDAFVVAALFLAWSLILLILAGRRLAGGISREHAKSDMAA